MNVELSYAWVRNPMCTMHHKQTHIHEQFEKLSLSLCGAQTTRMCSVLETSLAERFDRRLRNALLHAKGVHIHTHITCQAVTVISLCVCVCFTFGLWPKARATQVRVFRSVVLGNLLLLCLLALCPISKQSTATSFVASVLV